jgi:hypothetical protein
MSLEDFEAGAAISTVITTLSSTGLTFCQIGESGTNQEE